MYPLPGRLKSTGCPSFLLLIVSVILFSLSAFRLLSLFVLETPPYYRNGAVMSRGQPTFFQLFFNFFSTGKTCVFIGVFRNYCAICSIYAHKKTAIGGCQRRFFLDFFARHFADCVNPSAVITTGRFTFVPVNLNRPFSVSHIVLRYCSLPMSIMATSGCAAA